MIQTGPFFFSWVCMCLNCPSPAPQPMSSADPKPNASLFSLLGSVPAPFARWSRWALTRAWLSTRPSRLQRPWDRRSSLELCQRRWACTTQSRTFGSIKISLAAGFWTDNSIPIVIRWITSLPVKQTANVKHRTLSVPDVVELTLPVCGSI
jgi:hypothetical protein